MLKDKVHEAALLTGHVDVLAPKIFMLMEKAADNDDKKSYYYDTAETYAACCKVKGNKQWSSYLLELVTGIRYFNLKHWRCWSNGTISREGLENNFDLCVEESGYYRNKHRVIGYDGITLEQAQFFLDESWIRCQPRYNHPIKTMMMTVVINNETDNDMTSSFFIANNIILSGFVGSWRDAYRIVKANNRAWMLYARGIDSCVFIKPGMAKAFDFELDDAVSNDYWEQMTNNLIKMIKGNKMGVIRYYPGYVSNRAINYLTDGSDEPRDADFIFTRRIIQFNDYIENIIPKNKYSITGYEIPEEEVSRYFNKLKPGLSTPLKILAEDFCFDNMTK